ncbi:MAG: Colistin resistance protein EmrA [Candidatus Celerinatantimonas neptuna]|nr:MAG: Colistin resistance protein EmrA [Candidatus Celerinatantimonas neptuna]
MKKHIKKILLVVILGGVLGGFSYWYWYARFFQSTDNAYVKADITKLSARLTDVVLASYIQDNHAVKKGQLLAVLDARKEHIAVQKSLANLAQIKAALENAKANYKMQQSTIQEFAEQLKSAKASQFNAQLQYHRYVKLHKKRFVSQGSMDQQELDYTLAKVKTERSLASLQTQRDKLSVLSSQIKQEQANMAEAKANLSQARLGLSYTKIISPINGVISNRSLQVGMRVQAGQTIASIVSAKPVWITANFKETQRARMKVGQPVKIEIDTYSGKVFTGKVSSISPATGATFALLPPDNATGNFTKVVQRVPVRIAFDNPVHLESGLSATVTVDTRH